MKSRDASPAGVGLLEKAFLVLDLFTAEKPAWTQAEITGATQLPRSTLSRLIRYLCSRGYLMHSEYRGRYVLGFTAMDLARRAKAQFDLADLCADGLEALAHDTAETVMLTAYDPARQGVVCLAQFTRPDGGLRVFERIGSSFPLHAGAASKAVLARLGEATLERVLGGPLPSVRDRGAEVDPDRLRLDIEATRRRGFATSCEETYPGVSGVAVALVDPFGEVLGSMAIAGPSSRMPDSRLEELGGRLAGLAQEIETRMRPSA